MINLFIKAIWIRTKSLSVLLGLSIISAFIILASSSKAIADENEIAEMAKLRTYIGGADESDLKVQAVLPKNLKSKNETVIEDEGF